MKILHHRNGIIFTGLFLIIGLILIFSDNPVKTTPLPRIEKLPPASEGSIMNLSFYSKSLKKDRNIQVYLPEVYDQESDVRYPVIYFLHGTTQNCYSEGNLFYFFNNLISAKKISPLIIVKPDGSCAPWESSYFANSALNGNFEDYLVYDLVEFIDSAYKTIPSKDKRAIMGWSAGGSCAMSTALKHPEIYCGAVSHSGRMDMNTHSLYIPGVLSENGGAPVSGYNPKTGPMSRAVFTMAAAYSPNPNNPPHFVDFPFDGNGNLIDSVWNRWLLHDCSTLAGKIAKEESPAIYFDCGMQDETYAYPFNSKFAEVLDQLKLPYEFQSYQGGHYDRDSRYPIGLVFLDSVMNKTDNKLESGTWTKKAPMPTARGYLSTCSVDGKVYAIGGAFNASTGSKDIEVFNPLTNDWAIKNNLPEPRCGLSACQVNGKIYIIGGASHPAGTVYSSVYEYDPATDTFTRKADMPTGRLTLSTSVVNGKIYAIGGITGGWGNQSNASNKVEAYTLLDHRLE